MVTNLATEAAGEAAREKMIANVVESAVAGSTNGILADRASRMAWRGGSAVAERALDLLRSWWIAAATPTTAEEKDFLIEI